MRFLLLLFSFYYLSSFNFVYFRCYCLLLLYLMVAKQAIERMLCCIVFHLIMAHCISSI